MRQLAIPIALLVVAVLSPSGLGAGGTDDGAGVAQARQQERPKRGDDLARNQAWRAFLDRADRAFFAARMSTTEVKAKIEEADDRVAELRAARDDPDDEGGRADITGDVAFLERAQRAFTAAHMSTTDVQKWLREARQSGRD